MTTADSPSLTVRVHAALLFVQITFGSFSVVGKYVLGYLPPLALAGLRVLIVAPSLLLLTAMIDRRLPPRRELPRIALLGLFGVCINQVLFIIGLSRTTAINASILMPAIPVFTVSIAAIAGLERLRPRGVAGVLLAVAGALVMVDVAHFSFAEEGMLGNLLILLNCLSYAFFLVLSRPVLLRLPHTMVVAWSYMAGGLIVLALSAPDLLGAPYAAMPALAWAGLAFIVLFATLLNYLLNTWAIRHTSSSLVAVYTTLQPVVATVLAVLLLHESIGWKEVAGFSLIIAGLALITIKRLRPAVVPV